MQYEQCGMFHKKKQWVEPSSLEEKRKLYYCGDRFVTLDMIPTFAEYAKKKNLHNGKPHHFKYRPELNEKISIWKGDMTCLEIDAVVNAANNSLLGGGGIDGAIHSAAGSYLRDYNARLGGCETGQTKISPGFKLPAKWILSTVGPIGENEKLLRSCYQTCLNLVERYSIKSVGFCCVSTGIFGYPLKNATHVALDTVRKWLEKDDNYKKVDRIIFVVFLDKEEAMYDALVPCYFPLKPEEEEEVKQEEVKQEELKQEEERQEDKKEYAEESKKGESLKSVEEERIVNEEEKLNEQTKEQVRKEQEEEKSEDMKD